MATRLQSQRQKHRGVKGHYSPYPKCHYCGKPAPGSYHSARLTDSDAWGDNGLVLHSRCAARIDSMPAAEALAAIIAMRAQIHE